MSNTTNPAYHPEPYWGEVAQRIAQRKGGSIIAGDDEPYYRYKRLQFLKLLKQLPVQHKKVLEVGFGPGGNLAELSALGPLELHGADISREMVELAKQTLGNKAQLVKVDGAQLPYADAYFDLVFTATVLQHNTDDRMLRILVKEICRVSGKDVFIFERIEKQVKGNLLCLGRPIEDYEKLFAKSGFHLVEAQFLDIQVSHLVLSAVRKLFNRSSRLEGEPQSGFSIGLQKLLLPLTSKLDKWYKRKSNLGMLHFQKNKT